MTIYYILPPRKIVGSGSLSTGVSSLDNLTGDIELQGINGIQITPNGQILNVGAVPNNFVLKNGDTFLGNLDFLPAGGGYGVRLFATSTDPSQHAQGAIYYNPTSNTIRLYNGSAWENLAQIGALSQTDADARYLKLDASNGPITGDLNLSAVKFGLGLLSADPGSGSIGQVYFNTNLQAARIYKLGGWSNLTGGITQITTDSTIDVNGAPSGTITSTGAISVNQAADFTWTGSITFTNPVVFSNTQHFPIGELYSASQQNGDLILYQSGSWQVLHKGTANQQLVIDAGTGLPAWESVTTGVIGAPADVGAAGNPTTGYEDGFFNTWTSATNISDAFDNVNELLKDIAPAKAQALTGQSLVLSGVSVSTVLLSAGLSSAWYFRPGGNLSAGASIAGYVAGTSASYTLTSPNQSVSFPAGKKNAPAGTLRHTVYDSSNTSGVDAATYALSGGAGSASDTGGWTGTLVVDSVAIYNSIWEKATAHATHTQSVEGYEGHVLQSTEAGASNLTELWLDTNSTGGSAAPSFATAPSISAVSPVDKWLSGIRYYGTGTQLTVDFKGASGIFNRCYNAVRVAQINCTASSSYNCNPASPTNSSDAYPNTPPNYLSAYDRTTGSTYGPPVITLNIANQSDHNARVLSVTLYKALNSASVSANAVLSRGICTYASPSTNTSEIFFDEAQRLVLNTTTAWDPTASLSNGNSQVRNGDLQYPDTTEYAGFTGDQEYQRFFYKTSASTGTLTFAGISYTNVSAYGTGSLNVLIELDNDGVFFDLGLNQGFVNGSGAGTSRANSLGGKNPGTSSGGTLGWSLSTYSTGPSGSGNLGRYRLIIIHRDSTYQITSIVSG